MKQLKLLLFFTLAITVSLTAQRRYFDEVFASVTVNADVVYSVNATVLTLSTAGQALPIPLHADIYSPSGDTEIDRPLVIIMHTGNFLPPQVNGGCSGTRKDAADVAFATRLAKMGYVVAVADYRLGWNPVASTQTERVYTLINAAYAGVQDSRTAVRYFRKTVAEAGNPYKIDPEKITLWGNGTGGYIAAASATLDTITDTYIPKFVTNVPMVLQVMRGDVNGTTYGIVPPGVPAPFTVGDTLNYVNHAGYSSEFAMAVNLGGALADTSFIEAGEIPIISFHNPSDPFAPCGTGIVLVPPPVNLPVVEVSGSCTFQPILNAVGNQDAMINANLDDALSLRARSLNGNIEGFYPFIGNTDSSPWNFSSSSNPYGLGSDPGCETMNATHVAYMDTILRYFAPRACAVMGLSPDCKLVSTKELSNVQTGMIAIPNPSNGDFTIKTDESYKMQSVEIVDLSGRRCANFLNVNNNVLDVKRGNLAPGVYFARVIFKEGIATQKIILN